MTDISPEILTIKCCLRISKYEKTSFFFGCCEEINVLSGNFTTFICDKEN